MLQKAYLFLHRAVLALELFPLFGKVGVHYEKQVSAP